MSCRKSEYEVIILVFFKNAKECFIEPTSKKPRTYIDLRYQSSFNGDAVKEGLNVFLDPTEMHIQLVKMLQKRSERRALRHLGEGVHILWEALATIAVLAIRTRHVGVRVVDIT